VLKFKNDTIKTVLYTIGYEGINQEEFFNRLKQNNISVVAENAVLLEFGNAFSTINLRPVAVKRRDITPLQI